MSGSVVQSLLVPETASLRDAMLVFDRTALRTVLVCDSCQRLVALATEGDVRRALLAGQGLATLLLPHSNRKPIVGRECMSRAELVELLSERVYCLPVVDDEGIVR